MIGRVDVHLWGRKTFYMLIESTMAGEMRLFAQVLNL